MKVYSKPEILFEDFSLSTNIAAGCELINTSFGEDSCAYDLGGGINIFLDEVVACIESGYPITDGNSQYNGVCYHNPSPERNVFNS